MPWNARLLFNCISRSLLFHSVSPAPSGSMDALPQKLDTSRSESRAQVSHNSPTPVGRTKCPGEPFWLPSGIVPLPITRNKHSQKHTLGSYVLFFSHVVFCPRWNRELFLYMDGLLTTKKSIFQEDSARTHSQNLWHQLKEEIHN